jgi:putative flippase GtrA
MRRHFSNMVKYFFVGGASAVVDLSLFLVFAVWMELNFLVIGGLGFLVATWVNYLLCIRFVYASGQRFSMRGEVLGVYLASSGGFILHELILYFAHESFGLHIFVAKVVAIGLVFFWNFSVRNFYIFAGPGRRRARSQAAAD